MPKLKHLTEYHKKALEMKYKGNPYQDIAEILNSQFEKSRKAGFTEQTIKDWFKESGTLCETYKLYEQEMDEIHRETLDAIKKAGVRIREQNFRIANEMLVALIGSQTDSVKLGAIRELLDRVEGKPKEVISISEEHATYEQIIRELEQEQQEYKENEEKSAVGKSA
jgi:hypothetical protein